MTNVPAGAAFYAAIRPLFGGKLSQTQVNGINAIMDAWGAAGIQDDRQLAYVLATAFHETGRTMAPVRETFATSDASAKQRLTKAWKSGKLKVSKDYWSGGYFGRGLVQLTHEANYRKAGQKLGLDLVGNPSLALDLDVSALVLVRGMREGWFTTKKLDDYIAATTDYRGARRIVNGTDRAADIAEHAETFEAALRAARHAHNEAAGEAARQAVQDALEAERAAPEPLPPEPSPPPGTPIPDASAEGASEAIPVPTKSEGGVRWGRVGTVAVLAALALYAVFATLT